MRYIRSPDLRTEQLNNIENLRAFIVCTVFY